MTIIKQMLEKYEIKTSEDKINALKEVVQEITLSGLARANFFKNVAFYGGTALRIFYGLDRFSEDLDFSLISPNLNFDIKQYFSYIEKEANSLGLNFQVEEKVKTVDSNIKSAFLKGGTKEHILMFYENDLGIPSINPQELIKIKIEVDINPPGFAKFENKFGLLPYPYQVKLYDLPSLFAGKIHAILCRGWKNRVKGRDLYDYIFYLSQNAKVNLNHLKARIVQTGHFDDNEELTIEKLKEMLIEKFSNIDYLDAKEDVLPFIKDKTKLDIWSKEFFIDVTKALKEENEVNN
jgi:predicted nucleotidyltransferase component of viral defense system